MSNEKILRVSLEEYWKRVRKEEGDSRLADLNMRRRTQIVVDGESCELVFCLGCGVSGGVVTADWTPHIVYFCGPERNNCAAKYGSVTSKMVEVPEELIRPQR